MQYLDVIDNAIGLDQIGDISSIKHCLETLEEDELLSLPLLLSRALPSPRRRATPFRYMANTELSGLPYPCFSTECRGRSISDLARFSAIYADEVTVYNPFPPNLFYMSGVAEKDEIITQIAFGISVLLMLRPLIDRGMCTFVDVHNFSFCARCTERALRAIKRGGNTDSIYFLLLSKFSREIKAKFRGKKGKEFSFDVEGSPDILGHESGGYWTKENVLKKIPSLKPGQLLSPDQIIKLDLGSGFAYYVGNDVIYGTEAVNRFKITNLFASDLAIGVLRDFFGEEKVGGVVDTAYPFLSGAKLDEILRFREQEWHHLHDFREFVVAGISEGRAVDQELWAEAVQLEKVFRRKVGSINKKIAREGTISMLSFGAAVASGGLSAMLSAVIGVLGGGHFAKSTIPAIIDRLSEPDEVRESKIYYAWRLRKRLDHS